jgi:nicotinate-nucleotide pyrophosphorylase (carboxylating)
VNYSLSRWSHLPYLTLEALDHFIKQALAEDIGPGDYSTLASIPVSAQGRAKLLCKSEGILAGVALAERIFTTYDPALKMEVLIAEGSPYTYGDVAYKIWGSSASILSCERLVLNCMQRMSAIATRTARLQGMIAHTNCRLLDTRKTTPNFRIAEKWAVAIGGGFNHRFGLYDMVMLKDNHIDFCGGIEKAILITQEYLKKHSLDLSIEVEVRNEHELTEALATGGIQRVLLDNMTPSEITSCLVLIGGKVESEASGGITEENLIAYAQTGVDYISSGSLIYAAGSLDLSLKAID